MESNSQIAYGDDVVTSRSEPVFEGAKSPLIAKTSLHIIVNEKREK